MPLSVFFSPAENKANACFINSAVLSCSGQNILILAPDHHIKSSQARLKVVSASRSTQLYWLTMMLSGQSSTCLEKTKTEKMKTLQILKTEKLKTLFKI